MITVSLIVLLGVATYFASKYFRQKIAIRLLVESLESRTTILTHSEEFRDTNENWESLIDELNTLIAELNRLDKQSSGRLNQIDTTLGSLQEGVLMIDRDNYILLANKALRDIFPDVSSFEGNRVESSLHSSDFLEFIRDVKQGEGPMRKEIAFAQAKKDVWMEVSAAKLSNAEEGNAPWYLFVLHEISQLKQLEQMRKQFVANASHELKTPVSVIKGYSETLVTDHETMSVEDRDRFLRTIGRHSERLALLINDLLSLSRLENETPSLEWTHLDLFKWISDISGDYATELKADDRMLCLALPRLEEAWVKFDVLKLRQVVDNLIENSRKYTPANGSIEIGGKIEDGEAKIWIEDEGKGVPEDDLQRIFERFYRLDKGRSRETGGTGLGLSIVKHIIDWHDGRVWAENSRDRGLRVVFSLPLVSRMGPVEID